MTNQTRKPQSRAERIKMKRERRSKPLGHQSRTDTRKIDGMTQRWVKDEDGRIEAFVQAGWDFVSKLNDADGKSRIIHAETQEDYENRRYRIDGTKSDGSPRHMYLMAIETILYDEARAKSQKLNDQTEDQIKRGAHAARAGERAGILRNAEFTVSHE